MLCRNLRNGTDLTELVQHNPHQIHLVCVSRLKPKFYTIFFPSHPKREPTSLMPLTQHVSIRLSFTVLKHAPSSLIQRNNAFLNKKNTISDFVLYE